MSLGPSRSELTEDRAVAQLADLLATCGILASSYQLRKLFEDKWTTLSVLAHALHDAQERRRINARRQTAAELYSPEHEEISG